MFDKITCFILIACVLVTSTVAHDLFYKPVRPQLQEDLPDVIPIFKKFNAHRRSQTLRLPSIKSASSHENRCQANEKTCTLSNNKISCCPHENGTCCADRLTCCPFGFDCNVKDGTCIEQHNTKGSSASSVVCPDGQSECPDGSTCCQLQSGQYGCCPLEKATCCSDGVHCCPNGYRCDVSHGTCTKGDITHVFLKTKATKAKSVVCPDGQSQCPDGSTCCKLQSGQYGCCPLEKATCCSDGVHCCPNGYRCDVSHGTCTKLGTVAVGSKLTSCCTFFSGSILCCKNGLVCDPNNYQCTSARSQVNQFPTTDALHFELPIRPRHASVFFAQNKFVECGNSSKCGTKSTCCVSNNGSSRCCSLSNAVCCPGGQHCCPGGYTCTRAGKCSLGVSP